MKVIQFTEHRRVVCPDGDPINWREEQLCAASKGKNAGAVEWRHTGGYCQYASLDYAMLRAAEYELREHGAPEHATLAEFAREYRAIVAGAVERVEAAAREIKAAQG